MAGAAVVMTLLVRSYRRGRQPAALGDVRMGAERLLRHVVDLEERLPGNALDNASYVAVSYEARDRLDEQRRVEDDYEGARRRLERLRRDAEQFRDDTGAGGGTALADEERRLAAEVVALRGYADSLDERAAALTDGSDALL